MIRYSVNRCNSLAEAKFNITCKSNQDVLDLYRYTSHVSSFIQKPNLDPTNYYHPINPNYEYRFENYDINSVKQNRLFYSKASLKSNIGWLFSDYRYDNFNTYEYMQTDSYKLDDPEGNGINFEIHFTNDIWSHDRIYITVPDTLAVVGGINQIMLQVMTFLFDFYLESTLNIFLCNKLFEFSEEDDDKVANPLSLIDPIKPLHNVSSIELNNQKQIQYKDPIQIHQGQKVYPHDYNIDQGYTNLQFQLQDISTQKLSIEVGLPKRKSVLLKNHVNDKEKSLNSDIKKYIAYKKRPRNKIEIGFCEYFKHFYFCRPSKMTKTYKILHVVEDELYKKIDIVQLLINIDQLNAANKILLNKNQHFMLRNKKLKGVSVMTKDYGLDDYLLMKQKNREEQILELSRYLKIRNEETNSLSDLDKLLFISLEDEIQEMIKTDTVINI